MLSKAEYAKLCKACAELSITRLEKILADNADANEYRYGLCDQILRARCIVMYQDNVPSTCDIKVLRSVMHSLLTQAFVTWDDWSGDIVYPVPHPVIPDPEEAFNVTSNLWEGGYGDSRRELSRHIINEFKRHLSETNFLEEVECAFNNIDSY